LRKAQPISGMGIHCAVSFAGAKLQILSEAMSLLKNADKGFLSDIERLCLVAEVAINISRQRQLPPAHQFVEGELLSLSKLNHQLFIRRFSQVYQGLRAFLIYTTQILVVFANRELQDSLLVKASP